MTILRQSGVTLIELMIASTLALVLLAGLSVLYVNLKQNYSVQQVYARIQESARFTSSLLQQRIHLAGLAICDSSSNAVVNPAITGYDSDHLPVSLQGQVKNDTDVLVITSCTNNLSTAISDSTLTQMAYFIGDTDRLNSQGEKIYALFQKPLGGNREELISGISEMRIEYGLMDSKGENISVYVASQSITDWSKVLAVHINLIFDSIEPIVNHSPAYYFEQRWINPADHLLYQSWSIYAALREMQAL
jgi:prepilin-type N-terminal cleavage/methylation domain-containing protein